jgi:hypothetical protein
MQIRHVILSPTVGESPPYVTCVSLKQALFCVGHVAPGYKHRAHGITVPMLVRQSDACICGKVLGYQLSEIDLLWGQVWAWTRWNSGVSRRFAVLECR